MIYKTVGEEDMKWNIYLFKFSISYSFVSSIWILLFPLNYYSDIFNPLLPYESYKCKTNDCIGSGGNFICVINYLNSSSVNFTLRETQ